MNTGKIFEAEKNQRNTANQKSKSIKSANDILEEDLLTFQENIKIDWQQEHAKKNSQLISNAELLEKNEKTNDNAQLNGIHAASSILTKAKSSLNLESSQNSQNNQQHELIEKLKKQLKANPNPEGEQQFSIEVDGLGAIDIFANLKPNDWQFNLQAEKPSTKAWLNTQQSILQQQFEQALNKNFENLNNKNNNKIKVNLTLN